MRTRIPASIAALLILICLAGTAHATDTTAPTSTLTNPGLNAHLGSLVIDGTASDSESGVSTVTVRLQRAWGWSTEYWTGSTWSTTATNLTVSLDPANGTAPRGWHVTSTLPSGTAFGEDFSTGQYTIWRQVKDVANNTSAAQTVNFYSNASVTDGSDPTVTLEPDNNDIYSSFTDGSGCIIRGTAQDTGGGAGANQSSLGRVQVRLYKNTSSVSYYWTGSTWSTNTANLQTSLSAPDANGQVNWQCTAPMPTATDLASVYYVIRIDAFDRSGNSVNISSSIGITPEDTTQPVVDVTYPTEGAYLTSLSQVTGTALDPGTISSGLARVDVRLRRVVSGTAQYWNGTAWTTNSSYLASRSELSWVRNTSLPSGANLPSGAYSILATAYDNYGNASSQVTRNFYVNQIPQAQSQSLGIQKNVARPVTLVATDADGDAITYAVVTPPSHGTLTGTIPNLTYTPATDYIGTDSFTFTASDWGPSTTTATVSLSVVDDTTIPTGVITKPDTTTTPLTGTISEFYGSSNDTGSGVASVTLYLYRDWGGTSEYWTGSSWSTTAPNNILASLDADIGGTRAWHWPSGTNFPASMATGRYIARAVVRDYANQTAVVTKSFLVGQDSVSPTVTLTTPGANVSRLTIVGGTAMDATSGISVVQFRLKRSSDNQYWNGTAWASATSALTTNLTAADSPDTVNWSRTTGLPTLAAGTYTIVPIATDRYNNTTFGSTTTFQVVADSHPYIPTQLIEVGKNIPRSFVISAADAESDPITGFSVVTQPAHGVLSGTAPNLTYTPATDYVGADSFTAAASDWDGEGDPGPISINVIPLPSAPKAPWFANVGQSSVTVIARGLPEYAQSLTLQKKLQSQPDTSFADVAQSLAGNAAVNVTGLTSNTAYTFRYLAVGLAGSTAGDGASISTGNYVPGTPEPPTFSQVTTTSVQVTMPQLPANATSLKLEMKGPGATATYVSKGTGLSAGQTVQISGLSPTTAYTFRCIAVGNTTEMTGAAGEITTLAETPSAPGAPSILDYGLDYVLVAAPSLPSGAASLSLQIKKSIDADSAYRTIEAGIVGGGQSRAGGLEAETSYSLRYISVSTQGSSTAGASATVDLAGVVGFPGALTLSNKRQNGIDVTFPALPANADSFNLIITKAGDPTPSFPYTYHTTDLDGGETLSVTLPGPEMYEFHPVAVGTGQVRIGASASTTIYGPSGSGAPAIPPSPSVTAHDSSSISLSIPILPSGAVSMTLRKNCMLIRFPPMLMSPPG